MLGIVKFEAVVCPPSS